MSHENITACFSLIKCPIYLIMQVLYFILIESLAETGIIKTPTVSKELGKQSPSD